MSQEIQVYHFNDSTYKLNVLIFAFKSEMHSIKMNSKIMPIIWNLIFISLEWQKHCNKSKEAIEEKKKVYISASLMAALLRVDCTNYGEGTLHFHLHCDLQIM